MGKTNTIDEFGQEVVDPRPMALPVGFQRPMTVQEMVQRFVRYEVSKVAQDSGEETFEEADDFEVGDEPELRSPYELDDEQQTSSFKEFVEEKPKEKAEPKAGPSDSEKAPKTPEPKAKVSEEAGPEPVAPKE